MKKIILLLVIFSPLLRRGAGGEVFAQQLPLFSQYMLNDYFQNPAVAGSRPFFDAVSANRLQWMGITDAPRTYALSLQGPIKAKNMGVGGYLFTDVAGPTRRIGFSGSYAYHLKVNDKIKLALALSAGMVQFAVDASKLTLDNIGDYVFINGYQSKLVADLGASFYLYSPPKENGTGNWWLGGYIPQIYPSKLNLFETPTPTGTLATHFYFTGGYKLFLTDEFSVEPSLLFKMVSPAPAQIDLGARVLYKNKVWIGSAYRTKDAIAAIVGYTHKENLTFGYSYDITTSNLKNYNNGTHELIIALRFKAPGAPSAPKVE
ncbi:MAG: type IX secretion system membrane protein PorP/SprF [Bacteroidetes bacterium]|nr:MAG: type IX secretion system membrane protein PorP/SprF [Bacteroidota bacterium]